MAMEVEDDLFFADLSKQISLLIMDDDEDPVALTPSVSLQAFSKANYKSAPFPFAYNNESCTRESKGTGVFIPRSLQPRRSHSHRERRFNSLNTRSQYCQRHRHQNMATESHDPLFNPSFRPNTVPNNGVVSLKDLIEFNRYH